MRALALSVRRFTDVPLIVLTLAILTFNNWLLGLFFDRPLLLHGATVSELSVTGQPHYWLFRYLDITSGFLFIFLAGWLVKINNFDSKLGRFLVYSLAVLGLANIFDAILPLPCASTVSNCVGLESLSLKHLVIPYHTYSSIVIGAVMYAVIPLGGFLYAKAYKLLKYISVANIALGIITLISAFFEFILLPNGHDHVVSFEQQLQMILLALWIVIFYWDLKRRNAQ